MGKDYEVTRTRDGEEPGGGGHGLWGEEGSRAKVLVFSVFPNDGFYKLVSSEKSVIASR